LQKGRNSGKCNKLQKGRNVLIAKRAQFWKMSQIAKRAQSANFIFLISHYVKGRENTPQGQGHGQGHGMTWASLASPRASWVCF